MISRRRLAEGAKRAMMAFQRFHGDPADWAGKVLDVPGTLGMYRKTRNFCSDPYCSCGNPRRSKMSRRTRLTRQENRADDSMRDQLI